MLADLQNAYIQAVERAGASTVNVSTATRPYGPSWGQWPRRGFGSGVILDEKGHILTTHHVIDGAEKVIVTFEDGRLLDVLGPLGVPLVVDGYLVAALGRRVDADAVTHLLGHSTSSLSCLAWRRRACAGAGTRRGALPTARAARGAA